MSGEVVFRAEELEVGHRTRRTPRALLRFSAELSAGSMTALVGPNGAGKTTLLRTICGFYAPLSGALTVGGTSPLAFRDQGAIGYLPEQFTLPPRMSGGDFLELTAVAASALDPAIRARACELAGVDYALDDEIGTYSKGMTQRLGLAAALVPRPRLMLLDEPESGLDPGQRTRLRRTLRTLVDEGVCVLIASHDVTGVCMTADQLWLIDGGTISSIDVRNASSPAAVMAQLPSGW